MTPDKSSFLILSLKLKKMENLQAHFKMNFLNLTQGKVSLTILESLDLVQR